MDVLINKVLEFSNPTVLGLDPTLEKIPKFILDESIKKYGETLEAASDCIFNFNKEIIDSVFDIVPCVKLQCAYYEMYGYFGVKAFYDTINYAKKSGMYVIADGKRNDIGSTMECYGNAYLGGVKIGTKFVRPFFSDSLTVNAYLGRDTIQPLINDIKNNSKTIFVLFKTSNPSSCDIQDISHNNRKVSQIVGDICNDFSQDLLGGYGFSSIGAVIGATYPEDLKRFREEFPKIFFLVPGYGAQGASASHIKYAFNKNKIGAVINSSRNIIYAYQKYNEGDFKFASYSRKAAIEMRDDINSVLNV